MKSIYRSPDGKQRIRTYYAAAVSRLGVDTEDQYVPTRFGTTHLLVAGPKEAPPVVVLHGGNVVNPVSLQWFLPLMQTYRVFAPDTVGHPGMSAETTLSGRDDSYGEWLVDVLDGLGLQCVPFVAPSFGAGMALRLAAHAPDRIAKAALIVPCSFAMIRMEPLKRVMWPMVRYILRPTTKNLSSAVQGLFTGPVEPLLRDHVGDVYRYVRMHTGMPKTVNREELARFTAPTIVMAADRCVFFPAHKVLPKARDVIPNLRATYVIPNSNHFPSQSGIDMIVEKTLRFLAEA